MDSDLYVPGAWTTPHRVNHFDLTLRECDDAAGSDDSSEDDEGAIDLGKWHGRLNHDLQEKSALHGLNQTGCNW